MATELVRKCKYCEIEDRLKYLETVKREEISDAIKRAKEFGDLSENAEYSAAKDAQNANEEEIVKLNELLKNLCILTPAHVSTDRVSVGTVVTIEDEDGDTDTFTILNSLEADSRRNIISIQSPLGSALEGRKAGETVEVKTPGGKYSVTIVSIEMCSDL
ncbi:MAG TPA: transcription elongation factor GreA [Clostridia bacterium]|mgnify:CR=1 FL=1|nr:transcription elongation factor GreA [Clostridia bacterium]